MKVIDLAARLLLLLPFAFLLTRCAGANYESGVLQKGQVRYEIEAPESPWEAVKVSEADLAFFHPETKATLIANATCDQYKDAPLGVLLRHLIFGFTDRKLLREDIIPFDHREALRATLRAKLDGAPVKIEALVLKKTGCVYDVTLAAPERHHAAMLPFFDKVLTSFHALPRAEDD